MTVPDNQTLVGALRRAAGRLLDPDIVRSEDDMSVSTSQDTNTELVDVARSLSGQKGQRAAHAAP